MNARAVCGCGLACMVAAVVPAHAQSNAPRASSTSQSPAQPPGRPDPEIKRSVIEDDKVRIEELKVRGQVQRIVVSPKASGVRPYEIVPPDAGRDASQQSKGLSGQRLWQVFSF